MIIGQTICPGTYYGPWAAAQGDSAIYSGEVIALSPAAATLVAYIESKNRADTDALAGTLTNGTIRWNNVTGIKTTTSDGSALAAALGAKELVRYKYVVSSGGVGSVHFRMLDPTWSHN